MRRLASESNSSSLQVRWSYARSVQAGPMAKGTPQHILAIIYPPSEIDGGPVFGCFYRLRRKIPISQNWLKGQNMATAQQLATLRPRRAAAEVHTRNTRQPATLSLRRRRSVPRRGAERRQNRHGRTLANDKLAMGAKRRQNPKRNARPRVYISACAPVSQLRVDDADWLCTLVYYIIWCYVIL